MPRGAVSLLTLAGLSTGAVASADERPNQAEVLILSGRLLEQSASGDCRRFRTDFGQLYALTGEFETADSPEAGTEAGGS